MDWSRHRVLVTGAAGFIASHTCQALLARGTTVIGLDDFDAYYPRPFKERTLAEIRKTPGADDRFAFVEADICDATAMNQLFSDEQLTGVIHLAARAGVRPSLEQPKRYAQVNLEGTTILMEAARRANVKRFIMASSSSVYGNNEKVPFAETDDVSSPISPYAASKRACELMGHVFHHLYNMEIACLRFFTVFGPRQRPDLAIAKFIEIIRRDQTIPMFGDGTTSRDYTYIDDIVAGVVASYEKVRNHGYRIWNLGGNDPVNLKEMIATIGRVLGKEPRVEQREMQAGDVSRTYADLTRSTAELGYKPTTSFEEGVRRQWDWAREHLAG
ncbi:MAG: GDP-mannose 4,6-dehydratase [Phycisphaerales bacterium]|nr:GDP-mannose 4,6-dehydratase [Phycisphaerales bacterium]